MGIDPGVNGAMAVYDDQQDKLIDVTPMPKFKMKVGRTTRERVDAYALHQYFVTWALMGTRLAVMEAVSGRGNQMGGAAFSYSVGLVYMGLVAARIPVETSPPNVWKKIMRVPKDDLGISQRANEIFPNARHHWTGKMGGFKDGNAEAAIMAYFGAAHMLHVAPRDSEEHMYKRAETGG
jgi:hypothetical protein